MESLEEIRDRLIKTYNWFDDCFIENGHIIIEESYEMSEDEDTDNECYDNARETGELIIQHFTMLEIVEYYCHRHKYSIVNLRLKSAEKE
jgi:hypothetical protein